MNSFECEVLSMNQILQLPYDGTFVCVHVLKPLTPASFQYDPLPATSSKTVSGNTRLQNGSVCAMLTMIH